MGGDRLGQAMECITPSPPKGGEQLTANGASTSEVETQGGSHTLTRLPSGH